MTHTHTHGSQPTKLCFSAVPIDTKAGLPKIHTRVVHEITNRLQHFRQINSTRSSLSCAWASHLGPLTSARREIAMLGFSTTGCTIPISRLMVGTSLNLQFKADLENHRRLIPCFFKGHNPTRSPPQNSRQKHLPESGPNLSRAPGLIAPCSTLKLTFTSVSPLAVQQKAPDGQIGLPILRPKWLRSPMRYGTRQKVCSC